ncbi:ExbD/TolR family protein [Roseivirga sp. BDSF3-8]|uniref:ExbD/TolR family protein n=1 Tax=Roseivirga sp. BDSF3-8 TaxID=3241598 RepID=UPI00353185F6
MARSKNRMTNEVNAGSMADIAFLLLIFFLVTTQIKTDKGLTFMLPPKNEDQEVVKQKERNIFKVLINSSDRLLVEGEPLLDMSKLKPRVKEHVMNNGRNPDLSESPTKAIVSLKTDRGTSYEKYIATLDEIQGAYYEIYGERVGLTADEFRKLSSKNPREKALRDQGREGIPMGISLAEPTNYNN